MTSKVKYIEKELEKKNVSHLHHKYYLEEMMLVNGICLKHGKSHEEKEHGDLEFNSQELHEMLAEISQPCDELLITCIFLGEKVNCTDLFYPVITDEGQCCAFNIMPEEIMMRADAAQIRVDEKKTLQWRDWDVQD